MKRFVITEVDKSGGGGVMLFNFLKRNNHPTEICKLLKEKVLDVVKPEFILGQWIWSQDTVRISYFPEHRQVVVSTKNERVELTRKESKWLVLQVEEAIRQNEDQLVEEFLQKLRAL